MELVYAKSNWEMGEASLEAFLQRSCEDGFNAVEIYLPARPESGREIGRLVNSYGVKLIAQLGTEGATPQAHIESLRAGYAKAVEAGAILANSHTARDIFSFEDNCRIFEIACNLSEQAGVPFVHETHRKRPLFSGPDTRRYLDAVPRLRLTADFSHWFCVHESDLSDQPENVAAAIARTDHIHARVGFEEGPQIPDPSAPEWQETVAKFMGFWQRIITARKDDGAPYLTITPEFGPPPYMPSEPHTQRPLADAWTVNVAFLHTLKEQLHV